ncbi:MAG: type II toxin-antitoxin system VapC family toxin [Acidobacteriota bacterium]
MKFWDSSALVPLLVLQEATSAVQALALRGDGIIVWWSTVVECTSALARLERAGAISRDGSTIAYQRLAEIAASWNEIDPTAAVRETAQRFLRVHDLRTADALQLAAAFVAAEGRPSTLEIVCLDDRLSLAAAREGFSVLGRRELLGAG